MTFKRPYQRGMGSARIAALCAVGFADAALARPRPLRGSGAAVPNKGDTAWMLVSSALVLMMSIPGLALFYGGLVRTKNMALGADPGVSRSSAMVGVLWTLYGYSLAFTTAAA